MAIADIVTYHDLKGKTVFISGGAISIGSDIVRAFHGQGAKVTFVDIDTASAEALCAELQATSGSAPAFIACDVTDTDALKSALDATAAASGVIHAVVNNAANDKRHKATEVTSEQWDSIVAVNLKHQYFAAIHAFEYLKASGSGSVINFGSVAPLIGIHNLSVYSTCKSAVRGMTRSLAREFGDHGIRVNSLVPGSIMTPRQKELWISDADEKRIQQSQCIHRSLIGEDIAQMALFLASNASSACTSQTFVVDGGDTP